MPRLEPSRATSGATSRGPVGAPLGPRRATPWRAPITSRAACATISSTSSSVAAAVTARAASASERSGSLISAGSYSGGLRYRRTRVTLIVHTEEPLNAETLVGALARSDLTATADFYVRSHGPVPDHDGRLVVDGLVERPLSLSLDELRRFEVRELVATLQCAGNRRARADGRARHPGRDPVGAGRDRHRPWRGVALADVLRAAGVDAGAGTSSCSPRTTRSRSRATRRWRARCCWRGR